MDINEKLRATVASRWKYFFTILLCVCVCVCVDFSPHISKMISKGYLINIGCDAVIEDYLLVDEEQKLRVFQIKM